MRYLGIDYGGTRTGLAICDPMEIVVSPLKVVSSKDNLIDTIVSVVHEEEVDEIVVGLPINMDGSEGGQAKKVRNFADKLAQKTGKKIHYQDERLSSYSAKSMLKPAEMNWRKQKKILDAVAAANILRTYIDSKSINDNNI